MFKTKIQILLVQVQQQRLDLERYLKLKFQDSNYLKNCIQYSIAFALYTYVPFITFVTLMILCFLTKQYLKLKTKELTPVWILKYLPDKYVEMILQWINLEPKKEGSGDNFSRLKRKISSHLEMHLEQEEQKVMQTTDNKHHINPMKKYYQKRYQQYKEDKEDQDRDLSTLYLTQRLSQTAGVRTGLAWQYTKIDAFQEDKSRDYEDRLLSYSNPHSQNTDVSSGHNPENKETPQTIVLKKSNKDAGNGQSSYLGQHDKWEKLDSIYQKLKSHMPKIDSGKNPVDQIYKSIQVLRQLSSLQRNGQRILKVDDRFLIQLFLISTVGLTAQTIISQRSRRMLMRVMVIIFYFGCVALSTGTLSVILFKILRKQKEKKKQQSQLERHDSE